MYLTSEKLETYQKVVLYWSLAYGVDPFFRLDEDTIQDLANYFKIDGELIKKSWSVDTGMKEVMLGDINVLINEDFWLFKAWLYCFFVWKDMKKRKEIRSITDLRDNVLLYENIWSHLVIMNADSGTSEAMERKQFSYEYNVYNQKGYDVMLQINLLKTILTTEIDDEIMISMSYVRLVDLLLKYELTTRNKTMMLIIAIQMIYRTPFLPKTVRGIAEELYEILLCHLKNSKIVSIQVNTKYQDVARVAANRTRYQDNTTRLEIQYSFDNYDIYSLRLDLSHEGEEFVHFNNISHGGIRCCLLSDKEYSCIIEKNPELEKCFIQHGNYWMLKERHNISFTDSEMISAYEDVIKNNSHKKVFDRDFREEDIILFTDLLASLLPSDYILQVDKEGDNAKWSFQYNKLISGLAMIQLSIHRNIKYVDKWIDKMIDAAVSYGLIDNSDIEDMRSLDGMCFLVEVAEERLGNNR